MTSYHASSAALRLTPSNSPFFKSPSPRSPTKQSVKEEPGLHLRKVIGTTTASANGFDCLSSSRKFAFTAGAAAVVATVDQDLNVTQHFFRGNPSSYSGGREANGGGWPLSPSPHDPRFRGVKEQATNGSPSNRDWDSPNGRTTSAKDRVKAATSVALSPNGKWLAVGETGYRPRILIFSARDGSSESPVAVLAEHTFGVHALSFSPDSRMLASLGTVNDGFLYVWSIDERTGAATLSASNKCTTIIHSMAWMGRSIVTAGLRYVKVWRPEEEMGSELKGIDALRSSTMSTPRPKMETRVSDFGNSILSPRHRALAGKNSLLGELLEATFTSVIPISDSKAIVCTEAGDVCLLDDSDRTQTLSLAVHAGIRISAVRIDDNSMLHAVGADGSAASFLVPDLERRAGGPGKPRQPSTSSTKSTTPQGTVIVAIGTLGNAVVEIDSNRVIRLYNTKEGASPGEVLSQRRLTAHEDAVLGVKPIQSSALQDAAFYTFSGRGTVHFWDSDGVSVHYGLNTPVVHSSDMYGLPNELKSVEALFDGSMIASGDKYGSLAVIDIATGVILHQVRAHSAEVLDLVSFERAGVQYLASASRDRTVQLFICRDDGRIELLQTMDEHAGSVTGLLMSRDGDYLMSCSADRSIVVRQRFIRDSSDATSLAFGMLRAMTLKSSPTSMCLTTQRDTILVSTVDRCIGKYSTKSGQAGFSFKCSDNDGGEAAVMSKILYSPSLNGNPTIAGVSSSDKSVRLYSEYGSLIARDWGHTEGITDIAFVSGGDDVGDRLDPPKIATVAADSTIFLWDSFVVSNRSGANSADSADTCTPNGNLSTPLGPPLRKVISHSEMSRFRRDRSTDEQDPPSPSTSSGAPPPPSPQKVRKKTSRLSLAQTPRLEPGFRSNFDPSRRRSLRQRSPSPPSPRNPTKKDNSRRQTLGMSLRSKSSENILNTGTNTNNTGFGTLTSSTESVCRTLRAYRKKLGNTATTDSITPDALRELEKELKLTAKVVGEKSQGKTLDEATIAKLLDQASDKIVGLLDEKIKARVEDGLMRGQSSASTSSTHLVPPAELDEDDMQERFERSDTASGALET